MTNLLKETINDIARSGHVPTDIVFIGSAGTGHECTWAEFCVLADIHYDSGFGSQKVATDLIIVFRDGTKMWRHEYDGSEYWDFSYPFKRPQFAHPIKRLVVGVDQVGWRTVAEVSDGDQWYEKPTIEHVKP
jgi:hypothetical protein